MFDARQLLSEDRLVQHRKTKSLALASDIYRYRILRAGMGLYVDCDVYCVRPIEDAEYIMGREDGRWLNGAVLKLPKASDILLALSAAADDPAFVPPWYHPARRAYLQTRKALGFPTTVDRMSWGTLGPKLLTWYAQKTGTDSLAAPFDVFYPVSHLRVELLLDEALAIDDLITSRTLAIHLYNFAVGSEAQELIPPTSPLGRMLAA